MEIRKIRIEKERRIRTIEEPLIKTDGRYCASGHSCENLTYEKGHETYPTCTLFHQHGSLIGQGLAVNRDGKPIRCYQCREAERNYIAEESTKQNVGLAEWERVSQCSNAHLEALAKNKETDPQSIRDAIAALTDTLKTLSRAAEKDVFTPSLVESMRRHKQIIDMLAAAIQKKGGD